MTSNDCLSDLSKNWIASLFVIIESNESRVRCSILVSIKVPKIADWVLIIVALSFVNKVGVIAEEEGHHPDIELGWGKVNITLTTHAINGLSQNDFIVAAKINNI